MLRGSITTTEQNFDMAALSGGQSTTGEIDQEQQLLELADAATHRDGDAMPALRELLIAALGPQGFADAAAVASAFQGFNRVADAAGTEIDPQQHEPLTQISSDIGIDGFFRSNS
jgi:alkylhydroperoxidase family enzyme